ncbi:MAG: PKD domain-containing protein, partial [Actinomycetota bacterium]
PSLTVGTFIPVTGTETLSDLALSPDGKVLYVVDRLRPLLLRFALPAGTPVPPLGLRTEGYHTLVVAPDGAHVYVAGGDVGTPALLARLDPEDEAGITPLQVPEGVRISAVAIGTKPDGKSSLWVLDGLGDRLYEAPVPAPPNFALTAPVPLPSTVQNPLLPTDLFAVPDGNRVEVSALFDSEGPASGVVQATDVVAKVPVPCGGPGGVCPAGGLDVVVTPDQAPTARLVVTPGPAGQDTTLDASTSTILFGTIARYEWDFGDGTKATTTTPVTTHKYASPGPYTATVTETSWAGASVSTTVPSTVFTGQTMTRRGGPQARTQVTFTIGGGTPTETPGPT